MAKTRRRIPETQSQIMLEKLTQVYGPPPGGYDHDRDAETDDPHETPDSDWPNPGTGYEVPSPEDPELR